MPENNSERSAMQTLLTVLSVGVGAVIIVGGIVVFKFMSMIA